MSRNFLMGYEDSLPDRAFMALLPEFIRDTEKAHLKTHPLSALVMQYGKMKTNCGGTGFSWPVRARIHKLKTYTGTSRRTFEALDPIERGHLTWAGYEVTDVMSEFERLSKQNAGESAVASYYDEFLDSLKESIMEQLAPQHYIDGYAAGNEDKWKGLKSLFQEDGDSITITTGAARAAHEDDKLMYPEGTYAAIDIALAAYGGANEVGKIWPNGVGDPEYDFFTPLIVIGNSAAFDAANGSSTHTWTEQGEEVLSWTIMQLGRNRLPNSKYVVLMGRQWYEDLKASQRAKQRIIVSASDEMRELGFGERVFTISDGAQVILDYDLDEQEAIVCDLANCELRTMFDDVLNVPSGMPWYDEDNDRWKFAIRNLSQWKFTSPRNFAHIKHVSGLATG